MSNFNFEYCGICGNGYNDVPGSCPYCRIDALKADYADLKAKANGLKEALKMCQDADGCPICGWKVCAKTCERGIALAEYEK